MLFRRFWVADACREHANMATLSQGKGGWKVTSNLTTRAGTLNATDNATRSPQTVALSGTAVVTAPNATLLPTRLTFESAHVGTAGAAQTVTPTNSATADLTISSIGAAGDFAQTHNLGTRVAAGGSCTMSETFTSFTAGTRTGTFISRFLLRIYLLVLLIYPACACGQFSFDTNLGLGTTGTYTQHAVISGTNCYTGAAYTSLDETTTGALGEGLFYESYFGFLGTVYKFGNNWIPTSYHGYEPGGKDGIFTALDVSLSSSGDLTLVLSGPANLLYNGEGSPPASYLQKTSINLNSGKYIWHLSESYTRSFGPSNAAPTCTGVESNVEDANGVVSIILSPVTGGTSSILPTNGTVYATNPALASGQLLPLPSSVSMADAVNTPAAYGVSADGTSAVAVVYLSASNGPVTFTLSSQQVTGAVGTLTAYDPAYLSSTPSSGTSSFTASNPIGACVNSICTFIALLRSPSQMPIPSASSGTGFQSVPLTISASQAGTATPATTTVYLEPPPVVLVHGIWTNASQTWSSFEPWLLSMYPHDLVSTADYGPYSQFQFSDSATQQVLTQAIAGALTNAASEGIAATKVDVVGHSMGGLVTRYFLDEGVPVPYTTGAVPPNPVHKLVTIGTPHVGTPLATELWQNRNDPLLLVSNPIAASLCAYVVGDPLCTLSEMFGTVLHKPVDTGVESLQDGLPYPVGNYSSIAGESFGESPGELTSTEYLLDLLIGFYQPGTNITNVLNEANDVIVPLSSQTHGATDSATVSGVIHTSVVAPKFPSLAAQYDAPGEVQDSSVWSQTLRSLMGLTLSGATYPGISSPSHSRLTKPMDSSSSKTGLSLDLDGYVQVPISTVTISPANNSTLQIGSPASLTVSSVAKTISEVFLIQAVVDPADSALLYSNQSPFTISFIPNRLGSMNLALFVVFTDQTFATTHLQYTLQPNGTPLDIRLTNAPVASLPLTASVKIDAVADYSNAVVDVSDASTYSVRSGSSNVFTVDSTGTVTATGNGIDWLDATYASEIGSALITVGSCTYQISPGNQEISYSGGATDVQVNTQAGCSWTATSGSSWLTVTNASGTGAGDFTLTADDNTTGALRVGDVNLGNLSAAITQPGGVCSYSVTPSTIHVTGAGGSGTVTVSTACPIVTSSNATWLNVTSLSGEVAYEADANASSQSRTGTITVGDQQVSVVEAGALNPVAGLNPTSLSFGNQIVGSTSPALASELSNSGTAALTIDNISLTGSNAADFGVTNTCGSSVAVGSNCELSVTFTPSAAGTRTATLTVTDNASGSPQNIALTGIGVATAPAVTLSPNSLTFASENVGSTSTAQIVTLTNAGNAALSLTSITASGDFAASQNCGTSIAGGGSCAISVTFTPSAAGTRTGTLSVADNATGAPQTVALSGTGIATAPTAALSPTSLTFASTNVGATSVAQIVTLTNSGNAALSLTSLATSGDFAASQNCGTSLAAGGSCAISVTFTPSATGTRTGALSVIDNATGSPQTVTLSGTGVATAPSVTLSSTSLTFASANVGTASAAQMVTFTNAGTAALTVSSIAASGDFAQTHTCGTSVAVGGSCTISVTFTPSAAGKRTGTLTVTDNAAGSPQTVALSGTGVATAPAATLSPTSLAFAMQTDGTTSAAQTVTLTNSGTAALTISSIAASEDFAQTHTCGTSVAVGGSCTISVSFTPSVAGTRTGALTVTDNATGSPQTVTLSGTGVATAPIVTLAPTALTFASQTTETTSSAQTVTLTNSGNAVLNLTSIAASGDFAVSQSCGTSIAGGGSCMLSVTFTPTAAGSRTGTVSVTDNAMGSPQTVLLTGTGEAPVVTAPAVTLSPTSLTFAAETVGSTSAAQTVKLTNSGTAVLNLTSIAATGDFAVSQSCGTSLAAGGSCTLSVTFTPTSTGSLNGTLSITDNATGSPQTVSLTGGGEYITLASSSSGLSISSPGGAATGTIQIAPVDGFTGTVNLICTVAYQGQGTASDPPTCALSPAQAQISGTTPVSSTLTVSTTAATASAVNEEIFKGAGVSLAALLCFGLLPRRRWRRSILLIALGVAVTAGLIGCGSSPSGSSAPPSNPGTTAGSYVVTVTATSGTAVASITVSLSLK